MSISEIISKLIQFNRTERPTFIKLYTRDSEGCVIGEARYPIEAVFSHNKDYAEIIIEQSQMQDT